MNFIEEMKSELNYQLDNLNIKDVEQLSTIITNCPGTIYFMGVGKSGNISKHCCDLLKSISINCFYLECVNTLHGDIGTVNKEDIIIMFSKSGNTKELLEIIPYFKERSTTIVGICCDKQSEFMAVCDITFETPFTSELSGSINKIPTNSCMSHLLFSNLLVSILKQHLSLDQYKKNHPAGNIGNNLKKIKDVLIDKYPIIVLEDTVTIYDVLLKMTEQNIGCCFFVDKNDVLRGILTDGDIRRLLLTRNALLPISTRDLNADFYYETNLNKFLYEIPNRNGYIPVLNERKLIGIFRN